MALDLLFRLRNLLRGRALDSELNDELQFHLEKETEKLIRSGIAPEEAARRARIAFGLSASSMKDECREARGILWIEEVGRDLAYGVRMLRLSPGFTAVAVLSLALGMGANTAMFQLLDAVGLRKLPVVAPDELRIVRIGGDGPSGSFTSRFSQLSSAQWQEIEKRQSAFSRIGVWSPRQFNLADGGEMRPAEGMLVSGRFFEMLGVPAWRGQLITANEDTPGCGSPQAVLSYGFWQSEYGGDPGVIGKPLRLDGHKFTIAGVTPPSFFGVEVGRSYAIAIPLCAEDMLAGADSQLTAYRASYWLCAIGRLRPGWTTAQADAHLATISPDIFAATLPKGAEQLSTGDQVKRYRSMKLVTLPAAKGVSWLRVGYEKALWLLLGSAALVLLIACGNLANLLLARASVRTPEITLRLALGASRGRVVRQLLTESFLLALGGAAMGLAIAVWTSKALISFLVTTEDPVALDTHLDARVLAFSFAVALITCLVFGLAPALRTSSVAPASVSRVAGGRERSLLRRVLVCGQIALCVVLVTGAILFGRSIYNLLHEDPGFRPAQVLVTSLDLRRLGYTPERRKLLYTELLDRLRSTPGIASAARSDIIPLSGWESNHSLKLDNGQQVDTLTTKVSPGYFQTLQTPLLAGRDFGPQDGEGSEVTAIANEAFARKFLGGANPVGRTFRATVTANATCRFIGLVRNTKYRDLKEELHPIVYFPTLQTGLPSTFARFVVRSSLPFPSVTKSVREVVASLSPAIDLQFLSLDQEIEQSVARERLLAALGGGFGLLAGLLAAVGLYGLLSYSVESRRNEIGIRMALGARSSAVIGLIVGEAGWLLSIGVAIGLALSMAAGKMAKSYLYDLQPNDPITLACAAALLAAVGLVAAYAPARRAASLDPFVALRRE